MVYPEEIRVGNFVQYNPYGVDEGTEIIPLQIEAIFARIGIEGYYYLNDGFENTYTYASVDPITITPEWLERLGFFLASDCDDADMIIYQADEWGSKFMNIVPVGDYYSVSLHEELLHTNEATVNLAHIKYIHQLQNLFFALTGQELTVKELTPLI